MQELFQRHILFKTTYAYLPLQEHWDSDLFWFGDGLIKRSNTRPNLRDFPPLWRLKNAQTCHFFLLHQRTSFFEAHPLSPYKIWQLRALAIENIGDWEKLEILVQN